MARTPAQQLEIDRITQLGQPTFQGLAQKSLGDVVGGVMDIVTGTLQGPQGEPGATGPQGPAGEGAAELEAELVSITGAAQVGWQQVGSSTPRTVDVKLREIVTPADTGGAFNHVMRVSNTTTAGLSYKFGDYNQQHADTAASVVFGGISTQPNSIGKMFHRQAYQGDGVTVDFVVTAAFTIVDTPVLNVRAKKRRSTDGAVTIYSEGSGFNVISGYGTTSITVRFTAAPAANELVEITVISTVDDASSDPTLITLTGYDNVVNPIMSICLAAHCFIYNGSGHNTILGGSFHRIQGSYSTVIGGTSCDIGLNDAATFGCVAAGQSVRVDGSQSFGIGANVAVRGTASGYFGRNGNVNNFNDAFGFGYGAAPTGPSQFAVGYGKSADAGVAGLRQTIDAGVSVDTTDATITYLTNSSGSSEVLIPENSACMVRVDAVAIRDDNTQAQAWSGQFLVNRVGSAAPTVNGSASDVALTSINAFGAAAWTCAIRGITNGIRIRGTGEAAKNIRWVAKISLVSAVY